MNQTNCTFALLLLVVCAWLTEAAIDTPRFTDMLILSALSAALFFGELLHARRSRRGQ